jgi:hypothetical protein
MKVTVEFALAELVQVFEAFVQPDMTEVTVPLAGTSRRAPDRAETFLVTPVGIASANRTH